MTKHTILFLASHPDGTDGRALDREARSIRAELRRSGYRDCFAFETRWAAEPLDLLRELRELRPAVVHFTGHGTPHGLVFQTAQGHGQLVAPPAIAEAFVAAGGSVRLVVLSACYSASTAEALLEHVDCVVGVGGAIQDAATRSFAIGLYGGLGEQASIAAAFRHGMAAIRLEGLPDAERPQLRVRDGADADRLVLAMRSSPTHVVQPCPYPGMRPYAADDADRFCGRAAEVEELLGRLRANERELYVIGPSGSGKSSLVAAGALPRLARGVPGLGPYVVRSMRPGEHPVTRLRELLDLPPQAISSPANAIAGLLAHRGPGSSLLIVIDQLEELFTLTCAGERSPFLAMLHDLRAAPGCTVICTLRADFFGALMESSLWTSRRGQISRIEVGPLRGDVLREAITRPARDLGVALEPELVERLLADAAEEPGILPLLQETLVQLWDRRQGETLTLADYEALGDGGHSGLAIALSRRADATLRSLTPVQEVIARRILLRLVSFGEGRSDTRRQQPRSALRAAGDDPVDFEWVLQQMVTERLLTTDDDDGDDARVDLAHEVMIAAWPTLAGWIQRHRVDEQHRRQLESAAARWAEHGRGRRGLLDPIDLADAEAWQRTESARELGQSAHLTALIAASREVRERQRTRRRRLVCGAFAMLIAFAVVVAALATAARRQARNADASRQRAEANSRWAEASGRENDRLLARLYEEAGRRLLVGGRAQEAMPYLVAARQKAEPRPPLRMLFSMATRLLPLVPALEHDGSVSSAALDRDATRVVTASSDGTARVWSVATGRLLTRLLGHRDAVRCVAFSADGTRVVTASDDRTARIWDAATGAPVAASLVHRGPVRAAGFSPDGARVVTASDDGTARVWSSATGDPLTAPLRHAEVVQSAAFSPDGRRVVTASSDRTARVWDAVTGEPLTAPLRHAEVVQSAAFSPDGRRVVTASGDGTARVWDAATGRPVTAPLVHRQPVTSAAFSPDGTRVITTSEDMTARVWDAATGRPVTPALVHLDPVESGRFSPDGTRVVTASDDGTARVWNAVTGRPLTIPLEHQTKVGVAVFSPDGTRVVTAGDDRTARIWDAATGASAIDGLMHQDRVESAAYSRDGTRFVTASDDHTARVWDAASRQPVTPPLVHREAVWSAAFSLDGTRVVTASADHTARVWDAATGAPITDPLLHHQGVWAAVFSPDGRQVVTASIDHTARVWDAATGRPVIGPLVHGDLVRTAAFSPDGTRIVTASFDHTARVWDAATGRPVTGPLVHGDLVRSAVFSPDGTRIVTASEDHTAQVWDAATGRPVTARLDHQGPVRIAAFSPDGTRVVTASFDNTARVWDAVTGRPVTGPLEHANLVLSAEFSPNGRLVVTASEDHTARVWDAATGQPWSSALEHRDWVMSASFSPDGTRVLSASYDHTARVWDIRLDTGTLEDWRVLAERSPFVLRSGVPVLRRQVAPAAQREAASQAAGEFHAGESAAAPSLAELACAAAGPCWPSTP